MTVLIIAEHGEGELHPSTLNAVTAAKALGGDIHVMVAGSGTGAVADAAAKVDGVARVLHADDAALSHQLAEDVAPLVVAQAGYYDHVIAPATTTGKNLMPRVAALLDVAQISDVIAVDAADTFQHPIYAGNAIETVKCPAGKICLTIRPTAFDAAAAEGGSAEVSALGGAEASGLSEFVKAELSESDRPELTAAGIVVSGGRGVGSGENFAIIEALADKLGAAVGASRAAVDAGFVPNDYQVGQTGKVVAPELYIAVGISGAIQHLAGMKDSKIIVAINKDEDAPIFQVADYGLVADLFDAVPEMTDNL
ncbi:MAG: FAD-binding protein [Alphaproteobacteria bacterium]